MRILLSAFACSPDMGSEEGVGWAWAYNLACADNEVVVLTGERHRAAIEQRLKSLSLPNLHFEYVDVSLVPFWMPVLGCYPHYILWNWNAYRRARRLHGERPFEVMHHVTYAVFRNPSYLYLLNVPLIFGPVGGGESSPRALRKSMSLKGRVVENIRDAFNVLPQFDPFWQVMLRRCARVVVKTEETRARLPRKIRQRAVLALENMVTKTPYLAGEPRRDPPLKLLYAGRLLPWKGVHLALNAIAHLRNRASVTFTIVGKGPQESCLEEQVRNLGLQDTVRLVGWMPKSELEALYSTHDALLFPSLHDSGGTVVMEALAHGLPVICLALGGPAVTVDEYCARVVDTREKTESEVAESMAASIQEFAEMSASEWREMRIRAVRRAKFYTPESVIDRVYGPLLKTAEAPN